MAAIKVGKPSIHTLFSSTDATDRGKEKVESILRLKIRRAHGVLEDDPAGFDSSTDPTYAAAPVNG
jgi:hypothetical protein